MLNTYGDNKNGKIETVINKGDLGLVKIIIDYKNGVLTRITRQILNKRLEVVKETIKEVHTDCDCVDGVLFYAKNSNEVDEERIISTLSDVRRLLKAGWNDAVYDSFYAKCKILERISKVSIRTWLCMLEGLCLLGNSDQMTIKILRMSGIKIRRAR